MGGDRNQCDFCGGPMWISKLTCGDGCSSDPDAKDGVHCTDWKPTNDINNYGGKCQAIRACIAKLALLGRPP